MRERGRALGIVALVAVVALVLGAVYLVKGGPAEADEPVAAAGAPKVGAAAPNFRAMDIDGQPVSLEDYRGKPVWLLFQATWCSICRAELPDVEEAADRIDVVSIYLREDRDVVTDYAERLGLSIRSVPDPIGEISLSYLATSVPTHYFIDAEGKIASVLKGALSADEIDAQLEALGLGGAGNPEG